MAIQTSRQWIKPLLCDNCEQVLNRKGEAWVLRHCCRGLGGPFRLRDLLLKKQPLQTNGLTAWLYPTDTLFDRSHLVHFASGVFWKAAVIEWMLANGTQARLPLPPGLVDHLRQFLLGNAQFPATSTLLVFASAREQPLVHFNFPFQASPRNRFRFTIPGIGFDLWIDEKERPSVLRNCFVHSPRHPILLTDVLDNATFDLLQSAMAKKPL
ncbi:MAG: hypothetical protein ACYC6M_14830 [Terriglobales bacterium]